MKTFGLGDSHVVPASSLRPTAACSNENGLCVAAQALEIVLLLTLGPPSSLAVRRSQGQREDGGREHLACACAVECDSRVAEQWRAVQVCSSSARHDGDGVEN